MTTEIRDVLRAAAEACAPSKCADQAEEDRRLGEFHSECTPEAVLALLNENHALRAEYSGAKEVTRD